MSFIKKVDNAFATPQVIEAEREQKPLSLNRTYPPINSLLSSLIGRIEQIPTYFLELTKDPLWMSFLVEMLGIAAQLCDSSQGKALEAVPFLALIGTPFSLPDTFKEIKEKFHLMISAYKVRLIGLAFFSFAAGLDAAGGAIGNVMKSLSGGFKIVGVAKVFGTGLFFSLILPIILIVTGAIGGTVKGFSLWRNVQALKTLNSKSKGSDKNLKALVDLLTYLQGPQLTDLLVKDFKTLEVIRQNFLESHSASNKRTETLQIEVESALKKHDLHLVRSIREKLLSDDVVAFSTKIIQIENRLSIQKYQEKQIDLPPLKNALLLLHEVQCLFGLIIEIKDNEYALIEKIVELNTKLNEFSQNKELKVLQEESAFKDLLGETQKLSMMKHELFSEGNLIVENMRSEIHRTIYSNAFLLLIATLVFVSGVLALSSSKYSTISSVISLTSSVLGLISILCEKKIDRDSFKNLERFLSNLLESKALSEGVTDRQGSRIIKEN